MTTVPGLTPRCRSVIEPTSFGPNRKQTCGGVWTNNASLNQQILSVGRIKNLVTDTDVGSTVRTVSSAVFGGYAINHFGHFLTESLGYLPNAPTDPSSGPLIFLAGNSKSQQLKPWQTDLLEALGWSNEAFIVGRSTLVRNLAIPEVSFHQNRAPYGDAVGLQWRERFFPERRPVKGLKIYVSRSKVDTNLGRFKNEVQLEDTLRTYGYDVIHPQNQSIAEQIKAYRMASHVILAESSAIHLINLVCSSTQRVALLQRRPKLHSSIKRATRYFARAQVVGIDAILRFEGETGAAWPNYRGISTVDFEQILLALAKLSFIPTLTLGLSQQQIKTRRLNDAAFSNNITLLSRTSELQLG